MSCLNDQMNIQVRHLLFHQHEPSRLKLLFLCSVFSSMKLVHECTGKMRVIIESMTAWIPSSTSMHYFHSVHEPRHICSRLDQHEYNHLKDLSSYQITSTI